MMCYRDRTYCTAACGADECSRKVTAGVEAAAERAGLPLALSDLSTDCDKYVPGAARASRRKEQP